MQYEISANGWNYIVWTNEDGKITHVQCAKRFPKCDARMIGDDWMISDLQSRVDAMRDS